MYLPCELEKPGKKKFTEKGEKKYHSVSGSIAREKHHECVDYIRFGETLADVIRISVPLVISTPSPNIS